MKGEHFFRPKEVENLNCIDKFVIIYLKIHDFTYWGPMTHSTQASNLKISVLSVVLEYIL